jgi:hypothetical protein
MRNSERKFSRRSAFAEATAGQDGGRDGATRGTKVGEGACGKPVGAKPKKGSHAGADAKAQADGHDEDTRFSEYRTGDALTALGVRRGLPGPALAGARLSPGYHMAGFQPCAGASASVKDTARQVPHG